MSSASISTLPPMTQPLRSICANKGVTFPNVADENGRFMREFRTFGVPDSILIDRNGNIAHHWIGAFEPLSDENRAIFEAVLVGETMLTSAEGSPVSASMVLMAFGGGILSFLSPCLLPLVPAYVAFVGGVSLQRNNPGQQSGYGRRTAFFNGLFFVAGFSLIFVALGASAGLVGDFLHSHRDWVARIGGVFLLLLGLQMLGVLSIPGLNREVRLTPRQRPAGYGTAFIVGVAFAAGWSPCIGPLLAGILTLAASEGSAGYGMTLLAMYAGGLAIPFLAVTLGLDRFLAYSQRVNRWLPWIERVSGVLILVMSGVLLTGTMSRLIQPLVERGGGVDVPSTFRKALTAIIALLALSLGVFAAPSSWTGSPRNLRKRTSKATATQNRPWYQRSNGLVLTPPRTAPDFELIDQNTQSISVERSNRRRRHDFLWLYALP